MSSLTTMTKTVLQRQDQHALNHGTLRSSKREVSKLQIYEQRNSSNDRSIILTVSFTMR